jgi:hypothetical protein
MKNKILERAEMDLAYKYVYLFLLPLGVVIFLSYLAYTNFNELGKNKKSENSPANC